MNAARLYTPQVLAAAVSLARFPLTDDLPLRGEARSASCGSVLTLGLATDGNDVITRTGIAAQACAVGQASAAIFAEHAAGMNAARIAAASRGLRAWLAGDAPLPDWPGLELIAPARAYPARHGAILLAWDAAEKALA
ncbi:iron-sulfur cluster assembly scaffold protein [Croceicoccus sp. Ery5]|uniref:iron-sulfur cluster assembly scaffold protein n=1 Tax=Croceicoccus sp. Ery5 TaxID=1703340 RepID=UPI001E5557BC|nr:iron-sulfur cluster assembly scaffold protein [Croceicoccus sp. Ery5]